MESTELKSIQSKGIAGYSKASHCLTPPNNKNSSASNKESVNESGTAFRSKQFEEISDCVKISKGAGSIMKPTSCLYTSSEENQQEKESGLDSVNRSFEEIQTVPRTWNRRRIFFVTAPLLIVSTSAGLWGFLYPFTFRNSKDSKEIRAYGKAKHYLAYAGADQDFEKLTFRRDAKLQEVGGGYEKTISLAFAAKVDDEYATSMPDFLSYMATLAATGKRSTMDLEFQASYNQILKRDLVPFTREELSESLDHEVTAGNIKFLSADEFSYLRNVIIASPKSEIKCDLDITFTDPSFLPINKHPTEFNSFPEPGIRDDLVTKAINSCISHYGLDNISNKNYLSDDIILPMISRNIFKDKNVNTRAFAFTRIPDPVLVDNQYESGEVLPLHQKYLGYRTVLLWARQFNLRRVSIPLCGIPSQGPPTYEAIALLGAIIEDLNSFGPLNFEICIRTDELSENTLQLQYSRQQNLIQRCCLPRSVRFDSSIMDKLRNTTTDQNLSALHSRLRYSDQAKSSLFHQIDSMYNPRSAGPRLCVGYPKK